MIVITGATGNTGKRVAAALLAAGKRVRVVGRSADKLKPLADKGAEAFAGDATDPAAMTAAMAGASAAYLLLPLDYTSSHPGAYQDSVTAAYAAAVENNGVKHVVALSSIGAQHAEKTGPIAGLHRMEQRLNRIPGLNVLYLRPGFFMENLRMYIGLIQSMGIIAGTTRGEVKSPWVATRDIAAVAARHLETLSFSGSSVVELAGPRDVSLDEAAPIVGAAIGKPHLAYTRAPAMMVKAAMKQMGMSGAVADMLLEIDEANNSGMLAPEGAPDRSLTPTTLEQFAAEEFAPAYNAK